jgi:hypothetical protein
MHLGQLPCASFDRCGLLVVEVVRTSACPSVHDEMISTSRVDQRDAILMAIPSCLSHLCCPLLDQLLRAQTADFPGIKDQHLPPGLKQEEHYHLAFGVFKTLQKQVQRIVRSEVDL